MQVERDRGPVRRPRRRARAGSVEDGQLPQIAAVCVDAPEPALPHQNQLRPGRRPGRRIARRDDPVAGSVRADDVNAATGGVGDLVSGRPRERGGRGVSLGDLQRAGTNVVDVLDSDRRGRQRRRADVPGDEGDPFAVWRPGRIHLEQPLPDPQVAQAASVRVHDPDVAGVPVSARKSEPAPVRRPDRAVVVQAGDRPQTSEGSRHREHKPRENCGREQAETDHRLKLRRRRKQSLSCL